MSSEFSQQFEKALAEFEQWCDENVSADIEAFLGQCNFPQQVKDELRGHFSRENALQDLIGNVERTSAESDGEKTTGFFELNQTQPKDIVPKSSRIGRYKLLQKIGEGGMGTVWMAEQTEPVERRVALKVIKAGIDSDKIIARFEAERQSLAMMDHNNIARVLDGGVTPEGLPYFVMELVKGIPLNEYCDRNQLSINQRLKLFIPICHAIQHAHQKGIIHRDLKPSNVLVTQHDGEPVPKVIDFGLAKALDNKKLTKKTLFTEFGMVVGTLQYMSPEQAEMNAFDVDTRTDIYSLGAMLYELLTGSTPIEKSTIKERAILEVLEVIRHKEPPRPSTRLTESQDQTEGISKQRRISPDKLTSLLRGELDWIVMKAIDKDRNRRYESAGRFADDIKRFLKNEVVEAKPPSAAYLFKKFVARNSGYVAALSTIFALLMVGIAALAYLNHKAVTNARRLQSSQAQIERFMQTMFTKVNQSKAISQLSKKSKEFANGSSQIASDAEFVELDFEMKFATLLTSVGFYLQQSEVPNEDVVVWYSEAVRAFEEMNEESQPFNSVAYGTALENLAVRQLILGKPEEADANFEKAIKVRESIYSTDPSFEKTSSLATTLLNASISNNSQSDERLSRMIEVLESANKPAFHGQLAKAHHNRAYNGKGKPKNQLADETKAVDYFESYLERLDRDPNTSELNSLTKFYDFLATIHKKIGNQQDAIEVGEKAIDIVEQLLERDPSEQSSQFNAAERYFNFGNNFYPWDKGDANKSLIWFDKAAIQLEKIRKKDRSIVENRIYFLTYYSRAEANMHLKQFADAMNDFDVLDELIQSAKTPAIIEQHKKLIQVRRLKCLAETDPLGAASTLEKLSGLVDTQYIAKPDVLLSGAAIFAIASAEADVQMQKQDLQTKAKSLLKALVDQNLFNENQKSEYVSNEDFDSVRELDEFKSLIPRN